MAAQMVIEGTGMKERDNTIPIPETESAALIRIIDRVIERPDFDVAKLNALLDVRERYEKEEARKAFAAAKAKLAGECIAVTKDKLNKQYNSRYTSLGKLVETVTPYLSRHGFSFKWKLDQSNGIKVTCVLEHELGHSEDCPMTVQPDTSGQKNPIQQIKSAITYAKSCTFESVCGLASTDANMDDDGNGAAATSGKKLDNLQEHLEWIANCKDNAELRKYYDNAYAKAEEAGDAKAIREIIEAKNKRYKDLNPKVRGA